MSCPDTLSTIVHLCFTESLSLSSAIPSIRVTSEPPLARRLAIHDPKVEREQIYEDLGKEAMEKIEIEADPYIACAGAHALAILTE